MIRSHELHKAGELILVRQLDGMHDLAELADQRAAQGQDSLGNSSISTDFNFTGTRSLEEAIDLARHGWPEGMERISKIAEEINVDPKLLKNAFKFEPLYDVSGDEVDVDRYLQGEPENMVTYRPQHDTHGRILDLVVNVSQPAYVTKEEIENRGAAILAATETLRTAGYSIGIFVVEQCSSSGYGSLSRIRYEMPLVEPGQPINADTVAFAVMHPSFLRRLIFAANEEEDDEVRRNFGFTIPGGYGQPLSIKDFEHTRPASIVDNDYGLSKNIDKAKDFAQELIEESLRVLTAES